MAPPVNQAASQFDPSQFAIPAAATGLWNRGKELWSGSRLKSIENARDAAAAHSAQLNDTLAQLLKHHNHTASPTRSATKRVADWYKQQHQIADLGESDVHAFVTQAHSPEVLATHKRLQDAANAAHREWEESYGRVGEAARNVRDFDTADRTLGYVHALEKERAHRAMLQGGTVAAGATALPAVAYAATPAAEPEEPPTPPVKATNQKMAAAWMEHQQTKLAFQVSQFSGPLSMGSFKMTSYVPPMSTPALAVKDTGRAALAFDPSSTAYATKRASIKTALAGMGTAITSVRSPRSILSQTMRVGGAGISPTPGPSIASQVKPINVGRGSPVGPSIPGATKS